MALARRTDLGPTADEVTRLRSQVEAMQRRRADTAVIPVSEALASLFPDRGLQPGSVYALTGSTSLLLALLSQASIAGSWCAVIGLPTLGAEAAAGFGLNLDRLVLVPDPGTRWVSVVAALAEVVPVIAVRPPARPHDAEIARLSARLRDRGGVLLIAGDWTQADVTLRLDDARWSGVGAGHGVLRSRRVTVAAAGKRLPRTRRVTVQLPCSSGALAGSSGTLAGAHGTLVNSDSALTDSSGALAGSSDTITGSRGALVRHDSMPAGHPWRDDAAPAPTGRRHLRAVAP